jgi:hypothetical protein
MRSIRLLTPLVTASVLATAPAAAQSFGYGLDAGYRTDEFQDGGLAETPSAGLSVMMVLGGESSKHGAILFPVSGEVRYPLEMNADADMQMRLWNVSAGVGASVRMPSSDREWTVDDQEYIADEAIMAGYSGTAKLSFGPQGRMFVQGRYTDLAYTLDPRGSSQICTDFGCVDTYSPLFEGAREIRISAGIALGSGGGTRVFRFQVMDFRSQYERAEQNAQGGLDRRSRTYSLGMFMLL